MAVELVVPLVARALRRGLASRLSRGGAQRIRKAAPRLLAVAIGPRQQRLEPPAGGPPGALNRSYSSQMGFQGGGGRTEDRVRPSSTSPTPRSGHEADLAVQRSSGRLRPLRPG